MRARKRSGALAPVPLCVLLVGCGVPAGLAPAAGVAVPAAILETWEPVAVMDSEDERQAGVNGQPLGPGESLLFAFDEPVAGSFWMRGVSYPLDLYALDGSGDALGVTSMEPCSGDVCRTYTVPVETAYWLEVRPDEN